MPYSLDPTLQTAALAGGIDPTTGTTFGETMAKNSTNQQLQEQLVLQAVEKAKQAKIGTKVEEAQFDAQTYLSEKGILPKDQAMAQLKIVMTLQEKPQTEIDRVMEIAEEMLPETMTGSGLYQWWTTIQLPKYKAEKTYPTPDDVTNVRIDSEGNPLQLGIGYVVDANGSWHRSGLSKMEAEMAAKLTHPGSSGADKWRTEGYTKSGVPIQINGEGKYRFGDTASINDEAIYGKSSTMATSGTRASAEFARSILKKIEDVRVLASNAYEQGVVGPVVGRVFNQFLSGKIGSTGNPEADRMLGELRAMDTLLKSGAMRVHFGARGGQQMYDHFKDILNTGTQSIDTLQGGLDGIEKFMEGYAHAEGVPTYEANPVPPSVVPREGRRKTDKVTAGEEPKRRATDKVPPATSPTKTTAKGTTYRVKKRGTP